MEINQIAKEVKDKLEEMVRVDTSGTYYSPIYHNLIF